jgi:hypothetical protein
MKFSKTGPTIQWPTDCFLTGMNTTLLKLSPLVVLLVSSSGCSILVDPVKDEVVEPVLAEADRKAPRWSGAWEGTWIDPEFPQSTHAARAVFRQDGLSSEGTLDLDAHPCIARTDFRAAVDTDGAHASLKSGEADLGFTIDYFGEKEYSGLLSLANVAQCKGLSKVRLSMRRVP